MKILFFGDVFGKSGRKTLQTAIPQLSKEHEPDFIIANGENATHGKGILPRTAQELLDMGIHLITTGNHVWDQRPLIPFLDTCPSIIRPANYPQLPNHPVPGKGTILLESKKNHSLQLGVIQVMGSIFMEPLDCPFRTAERETLSFQQSGINCVLIDFHGEASSEKQAFAHFMDGKVSAVLGTHSHVQTADERILPEGTATITDVGMCGCFDSVIGVKKEISIQKFLTKRPVVYEPAEGPGGYNAVIVEIDEKTGKAIRIERLCKYAIL